MTVKGVKSNSSTKDKVAAKRSSSRLWPKSSHHIKKRKKKQNNVNVPVFQKNIDNVVVSRRES